MGDRALVTFHTTDTYYSPAVYLHWCGSDVPEMLVDAAPKLRKGDPDYSAARFCGHCHEQLSGNTGLGLLDGPSPGDMPLSEYCEVGQYGHGDAGVFFVNVQTGEVRQFGGYELELPEPLELPR